MLFVNSGVCLTHNKNQLNAVGGVFSAFEKTFYHHQPEKCWHKVVNGQCRHIVLANASTVWAVGVLGSGDTPGPPGVAGDTRATVRLDAHEPNHHSALRRK